MITCRVERRTKAMQKSVKFTRAESTTEKDKDRVCHIILPTGCHHVTGGIGYVCFCNMHL